MGQPRPLLLIFVLSNTNFTENTVDVSRIRTRIVGVEVVHADHLTTITAPFNHVWYDSRLSKLYLMCHNCSLSIALAIAFDCAGHYSIFLSTLMRKTPLLIVILLRFRSVLS